MSTEENKAVSRRVAEEIFNGGNLDLADELYASDYVLHDPSLPEDLIGPEGIKQYAAMNLGAVPDGRVTLDRPDSRRRQGGEPLDGHRHPHGRPHGHTPDRQPSRDIGCDDKPLLGGQNR